MSTRTLLLVLPALAFVTAACTTAETQRVDSTEDDVAAVHDVIDEWLTLANANDVDAIRLVCDDLEVIPPGAEPVVGPAAKALFRSFFENFTLGVESTTVELIVSGDWAIRRYAYEMTLTPKMGGDAMIEKGHGIHMFRRQDDGSWCLAKDIWNTIPEPVEPT